MEEVIRRILAFRDERDWMQFHDPKNLAMSVAIEAAELMEEFQWKTKEESEPHADLNRDRIADEVADVAIYLFELADILKIDLIAAINAKLDKNAIKYPVEKARGSSKKYTEL